MRVTYNKTEQCTFHVKVLFLDSVLCTVGATQAETRVAREVLFLQTFM